MTLTNGPGTGMSRHEQVLMVAVPPTTGRLITTDFTILINFFVCILTSQLQFYKPRMAQTLGIFVTHLPPAVLGCSASNFKPRRTRGPQWSRVRVFATTHRYARPRACSAGPCLCGPITPPDGASDAPLCDAGACELKTAWRGQCARRLHWATCKNAH